MVDGFDGKLHVFSSGKAQIKSATIVLMSGWGTTSPTIDFYPLWSRLDENTVVLERPGYGWSENTERTRTVKNIMEEDRLALKNAGFSPPYLLVAHSMGGLEAAYFTNYYPNEVYGVVLIDSMAPAITLQSANARSSLDKIVPAAKAIGLLRLVNFIAPSVIDDTYAKQNNYSFVDDSLLPIERALTLKNAQNSMMKREWDALKINAQTIKMQGFPSNIPLTAIMSDTSRDNPLHAEMLEAQQAWVNQSETGRLTTLQGGHYLHHYDPDGICKEIEEMLAEGM